MTSLLKLVSTTVAITLILAGTAAVVPYTATAFTDAPRCVFNTIVQPSNNGGTTLSWKAYDAHTVHISDIGEVGEADSLVVYPTTETTYTLTATGRWGVDTCTVKVLPTSSYSFDNGIRGPQRNHERCEMWTNPDFVVPGGTAIISWNAGNALRVWLDHGIGTVSRKDSRVVPNTGVPETYTLVAEWPNGHTRTCSTTVYPASGAVTPPTFSGDVTHPSVVVSNVDTHAVSPSHVAINQVPYTGTNDVAYVVGLAIVALGAFALLFARRRSTAEAFATLTR